MTDAPEQDPSQTAPTGGLSIRTRSILKRLIRKKILKNIPLRPQTKQSRKFEHPRNPQKLPAVVRERC